MAAAVGLGSVAGGVLLIIVLFFVFKQRRRRIAEQRAHLGSKNMVENVTFSLPEEGSRMVSQLQVCMRDGFGMVDESRYPLYLESFLCDIFHLHFPTSVH